MFMIIRKGA